MLRKRVWHKRELNHGLPMNVQTFFFTAGPTPLAVSSGVIRCAMFLYVARVWSKM